MKDFITTFKTIGEYNTWKSSNRFVEPNATYISGDRSVITIKAPNPYLNDYLTFTALESGTFKLTRYPYPLQYSLDNGKTWTALAGNTDSPIISAGSKILWKQTGLIPIQDYGIGTFSATGNFEASGNIMSLYYGDNFIGQKDLTGKDMAFFHLFHNCNKLVNAENLILPATTLANDCYSEMFTCTSFTTAPELPATTLTSGCYAEMFRNCTSLTTAPELPATTLVDYCYWGMFDGCTSLTTAPELPATTLVANCYQNMFNGCTSLNYIKCLATDISASSCTNGWVSGVASTGTFVKDASTDWSSKTGDSGIPSGWTVQSA